MAPIRWLELPDYEEMKARTRSKITRINGRKHEAITNTLTNPADGNV